jgi:hypothetical protein
MAKLIIPRRKHVISFAPLVIAALFSVAGVAFADNAAIKSGPPKLFKANPHKALVYFVNDFTRGDAHVYVDRAPLGYVPRAAYTAALLKPGVRLIWGTTDAKWYDFRPGSVHLLRLVKVSGRSRVWVADNPSDIRELVLRKKLMHVTTSKQGLAQLQAKVGNNYKTALKRAEDKLALPYQKGFHALDLEGNQPTSAKVNQ